MPFEFSYVSYRTTKKRLHKQLQPFTRKEFIDAINPIIADIRGVDRVKANQAKHLRSDEVLALLEQLGEPKENFAKKIVLSSTRVTRHELSIKIPYLCNTILRRKAIAIVMNEREIPFTEARYVRTLNNNELLAFLMEIGEGV